MIPAAEDPDLQIAIDGALARIRERASQLSATFGALGDAGVKYGLPRAVAYRLAAQTALGTGKMQLQTGMHPGEIKDGVCSPAGTTIRGVEALEACGVRHAHAHSSASRSRRDSEAPWSTSRTLPSSLVKYSWITTAGVSGNRGASPA